MCLNALTGIHGLRENIFLAVQVAENDGLNALTGIHGLRG